MSSINYVTLHEEGDGPKSVIQCGWGKERLRQRDEKGEMTSHIKHETIRNVVITSSIIKFIKKSIYV